MVIHTYIDNDDNNDNKPNTTTHDNDENDNDNNANTNNHDKSCPSVSRGTDATRGERRGCIRVPKRRCAGGSGDNR